LIRPVVLIKVDLFDIADQMLCFDTQVLLRKDKQRPGITNKLQTNLI